MKECPCNMYQQQGTCWHRGYKWKPLERQKPEPILPAFKRMKERVQHPSEIAEHGISTR